MTADFTNTGDGDGHAAGGAERDGQRHGERGRDQPCDRHPEDAGDSQQVVSGGTATFTIRVENTGDVALTNVVRDRPAGAGLR